MAIVDLVETMRERNDCKVLSPEGIPVVDLALPLDLKEFYGLCGGAELFKEADYTITIVPPDEFRRANPVIVGQDCSNDISFDWFVVGKSEGDYITIDLNDSRLGRCYDSFHETHGVVGECRILALTFESLLDQLLKGQGDYWYWLQDDFEFLGDAYDDV